MSKTVIVWFRRDFRLNDHTALEKAISYCEENDAEWMGIFQLDPHFTENIDLHHDYFFQTVAQFQNRCQKENIPFQIVYGHPIDVFEKVTDILDVKAVFFNEDKAGYGARRDEEVCDWLKEKEIEFHFYQDYYLHDTQDVRKQDNTMYKVFTPYYKQWRTLKKPQVLQIDLKKVKNYALEISTSLNSDKEFNNVLEQCERDWKAIGEKSAHHCARRFVKERLKDYDHHRDIPSLVGTSKLSPYLKTGTLSVRTLFHMVAENENKGVETFIQELAWRDFYGMVHEEFPEFRVREFQSKYQGIPWNDDNDKLNNWKKGETGFPIVDAGMRQLNQEGWMHNRLRMITASFLTKDYLIDWRSGERYFEEKLIDYDESSNTGGWQWASSTGTDAVPYFRIFNPTTQAERFDPDGTYIRKYVPELKNVSKKYIHQPSKMSDQEQKESSCVIGQDYPHPTVDHKEQRQKVLSVYKERT
ncbi:deoxyribodipyrimidine photo-lyase [Bacillus hwajinpoensis]|uniref:Deoxyribodipyrimidine photo-lyase n=1 Tax=Guptibacillus hwajinpoensis TaxID=208199 RepID=A0A845F1L7_9BACL|nr:deoxyribodipyrimidine photo-lyase [Pseudalkalibacillus hwajinpoensis]MYL64783.1 deoxyribodipyrimidine photo-lyase [Pseudalkalibacillus hwajinpoensis]